MRFSKSKCRSCTWVVATPITRETIDLEECIQRGVTKMIQVMEHLSYEDRLRKLGLFSLE